MKRHLWGRWGQHQREWPWLADRELQLEILQDALREHVNPLSPSTFGPRTPLKPRWLGARRPTISTQGLGERGASCEGAGLPIQWAGSDERACHGSDNRCGFRVLCCRRSLRYRPGHPGADDNASAVAVMLELASRLRQADEGARSLRCVHAGRTACLFDGHQGSRFFVRQCQSAGDHVLGAIVLEMVGYTAPRQRYPFISRWPGFPAQGNFTA